MLMLRAGSCAVIALVVAAGTVGSRSRLAAGGAAIDLDRSHLTINVYKSGVFSAFADNHTIRAPLQEGSLSATGALSVAIRVRARDLQVLDPGLSPAKRQEVQTRMLGSEVLDVETYPDITFASTAVAPAGADRWTVTGTLTLHGRSRALTLDTGRAGGIYRGSVRLKQRDFGITPISIAGGTVKVKDEVLIEFEIAAAP
jgi:YceI-like domain